MDGLAPPNFAAASSDGTFSKICEGIRRHPIINGSIMATSMAPARPLAGLKRALRQCRLERRQQVRYVSQVEHPSAEQSPVEQSLSRQPSIAQTSQNAKYPSLQPMRPFQLPQPTPGFRPSQAIKQNREYFHLSPVLFAPSFDADPITPSRL